ncbi:hypothetical protein OHT59_18220 [Streptomyces sp. NBC_00243]|uniref:hypothetical protein n=1 Tax=Streptomyces sp. NBC_00243 TaxID=2975688 RepID=UPI002DDB4483|nr:hypothetical protein [Streptomyces sp. NBC_00243]WRZ20291.1 hypothetical protein OHT59_18220 [Streptomyces sp. NBC_00243]
MPDRSLRLPPLLLRERRPSPVPPREGGGTPDSAPSGEHGSADGNGGSGAQGPDAPPSGSTGSSGSSGSDDNPFAPPPEGAPDRPWQPRRPANGQGSEGSGSGEHGDSDGQSPWGSQWSDRQPGPSSGGGFGDRPGAPQGQGQGQGPGGPEGSGSGPGTGMRWDPTDPAQRKARFALLSGMWAFFFALFSWPYVALLLGALALYWGISALRAKPRTPDPDSPAPDPAHARPQKSAAVSGLVTASLAIAMVAAGFTAQLVYSDYYACTNDALTNVAKESCNDLLPKELRGVLGTQG